MTDYCILIVSSTVVVHWRWVAGNVSFWMTTTLLSMWMVICYCIAQMSPLVAGWGRSPECINHCNFSVASGKFTETAMCDWHSQKNASSSSHVALECYYDKRAHITDLAGGTAPTTLLANLDVDGCIHNNIRQKIHHCWWPRQEQTLSTNIKLAVNGEINISFNISQF